MDNNTKISYERVKEDAATIKNCAGTMESIFEDVKKTMLFLNNNEALVGRAGDAMFQRFNALKSKFDSYTKAVERFANLIYSAEESTRQTENVIEKSTDVLNG